MSEIPPIGEIRNQLGLNRHDKTRRKSPAGASHLGSETISKTNELEFIEAQVDKLMNMPDIRPEMLELGKKLAQNKDFPSGENMEKLAETLLGPLEDSLD